MIRQLHVIADLDYGGAATQLGLLASASAERGDAVAVASLRRPGPAARLLREAGVGVHWIGRRFACDPIAALRLRRLVRDFGAEVVQSWDAASAAFCGLILRKLPRATWIDTVRRPCDTRRNAANGVLVPDEATATAVRRVGVDANKISMVPNAVDHRVTELTDRREARSRLRAAGVDVPHEASVIATIARHDDARVTKELVWASDLVRIVRPGLRYLVAGDGSARAACERFSAEATEPGTVQWLGPWADMVTVLAAADLVWCGGDAPTPTPALEATALRRPVIAARPATAAPDALGVRLPLGDRAAWARESDRQLAESRDPVERATVADAVLAPHRRAAVSAAHAEAITDVTRRTA